MKCKSLLFAATLLCSLSATAQDYAPQNWKFSAMPLGTAKELFIPEMCTTKWGADAPFRLADNGKGAIGMASQSTDRSWDAFTEEEKATFNNMFESSQIVEVGGEHVLCLAGKDAPGAPADVPGVVKTAGNFQHATLFLLGGTDQPLNNYYRLTFDYRAITTIPDDGYKSLVFTLATSHYDGIDKSQKIPGTSSYRQFGEGQAVVMASYNDSWTRCQMDFWLEDNTDTKYKELPVVIKLWLGEIYNKSILLVRDIKMEKIDNYDAANVPGSVSDYVPTTGISQTSDNASFVMVQDGVVRVVDAKAPVKVYDSRGMLVKSIDNPGTVEGFRPQGHGVFIVKVGKKASKVVL